MMEAGMGDPRELFRSSSRSRTVYIAMNTGTTNSPFEVANTNLRGNMMDHLRKTFTSGDGSSSGSEGSGKFRLNEENNDHGTYLKHLAMQGMVVSPPGE